MAERQGNSNRKVTRKTVEKWTAESDKDLDTMLWLKFDVFPGDCEHMSKIKCSVCGQFQERLVLMWNYNPASVNGTATSSYKEHAITEMYK